VKNAATIFLLFSFACHAQVRVPMTSSVRYEYVDSQWRAVDSTAYTYSEGGGSVDTGAHYAACGYDTGIAFHKVKKKYRPYKRETVTYDAGQHTEVHYVWLPKNKGWTISEVAMLEFDSYGDTVDFKHGLWDAAHNSCYHKMLLPYLIKGLITNFVFRRQKRRK
jgi:hypothetical protein